MKKKRVNGIKSLRPRHKYLATLLANGWEEKKALEEVGISYSHWFKNIRPLPMFKDEVERQREKVVDRLITQALGDPERDKVRRLIPVTAEALKEALEDGTTEEKLEAATIVLRCAFP